MYSQKNARALALFTLVATTIAAPAPQNGGPEDKKKVTEAPFKRNLWPKDGPSCGNIKQTTIGDCFLAATLCVLAERGKEWLQSAVQTVDPPNAGNGQNVASAKFHLFKSKDINKSIVQQTADDIWQEVNFIDNIKGKQFDATPMSEEDDFDNVWWVAGFQVAFAKTFGHEFLDGGYAAGAMAMLTNRVSVYDRAANQDEYFEIASKATYTPITLSTKDKNTKKLVENHVYAVFLRKDGRRYPDDRNSQPMARG